MSATTARPAARPAIAGNVTFGRVLRSEWIKLRSLRSTWINVMALLGLVIGFSVLIAQLTGGEDAAPDASGQFARSVAGMSFAVLQLAALGAIVGSREFTSGLIRTSFTAVPRRLPVLWGKVLAFAGLFLPVALVAAVLAFLVGTTLMRDTGTSVVSLSDPEVLRALAGYAYYVVCLGLIGLALGVLLRSTAASVSVVLGVLMFASPLLSLILPEGIKEWMKFLPDQAGNALSSIGDQGPVALSPLLAGLVVTAWTAGALALAAWAITRRDP